MDFTTGYQYEAGQSDHFTWWSQLSFYV